MTLREEVARLVAEQAREAAERAVAEREARTAKRVEELKDAVAKVLGGHRAYSIELAPPAVEDGDPWPEAVIDGDRFVGRKLDIGTYSDQYEVRLVWTCPRGHHVWLPRGRLTYTGADQPLSDWGARSLVDLAEQFDQHAHYTANPATCPDCAAGHPAPDDDANAIAAAEDAGPGKPSAAPLPDDVAPASAKYLAGDAMPEELALLDRHIDQAKQP